MPQQTTARPVQSLCNLLDLSRPDLAELHRAWNQGNEQEAADALVQYAGSRQLNPALRPVHWGRKRLHLHRAHLALEDKFDLQGVSYQQPRRPDGGLDWEHRGPNHDPEWSWFLNRHGHFHSLLVAYQHESEPSYLKVIEEQLVDWIASHPPPSRFSFSAPWRPLEAARRVIYAWLDLCFPADGKALLGEEATLQLWASVAEHAEMLRHRHTDKGNHLLTEMRALLIVALAWPDFKPAGDWLSYAIKTFETQLFIQTYPDGAHTELSNHYQRVTVQEAQQFWNLVLAFELQSRAPKLGERVALMWDYFAGTMRPDGRGPLNNDGALDVTVHSLGKLDPEQTSRELRFIATFGAEGDAPGPVASRYFPWAGQAITREDWSNREGQWARFDLGPHGTDHQHSDYLNIELMAGRRTLLADPGRFTYKPGPYRDYFTGPEGHNVLRLNGAGAADPPNRIAQPLPALAEFADGVQCFAGRAAFDGQLWRGTGQVPWTRVLFFKPGQYWLVLDHLALHFSAEVNATWHLGPECAAEVMGRTVVTTDTGKINLLLKPALPDGWRVSLVSGQEHPAPKGWYSRNYNRIQPCPVAEFAGGISGPTTLAWLLLPTAADSQSALAEIDKQIRLRCETHAGRGEITAEVEGIAGQQSADQFRFELNSAQLERPAISDRRFGELAARGSAWEARLG